MRSGVRHVVLRYALAAVVAAAVVAGCTALRPLLGEALPYGIYLLAVAAVGRFAGLGPALLVAIGAGVAEEVLFAARGPGVAAAAHRLALSLYVVLGLVVLLVTEAHDRTRRRLARAAEALAASERRFQAITDTVPVMICESGPDMLCTWLNGSWLDFTGRTLEEECGTGWAEGIHPDDYERVLAAYASAFETRRPFTVEYRLRRYDGEYRWVLDRGRPRLGERGEFLGFIGSAVDVTDHRRLEQERAAVIARERTAREEAEAARNRATFLADATGMLAAGLDADDALARTYALFVPRLAAWCVTEVIDAEGPRRAAAGPELTAATDAARRTAHAEVLRDGRMRRLPDAVVLPLAVGDRLLGTVACGLEPGREWTAADRALAEELARRAAQALDVARRLRDAERRARDAEAASRAREEYLATVVHELRTPLAAILGWTHVLRRSPGARATHALDVIERSGRAQARLLENLLDMSHLATGRLRLQSRPVGLPALVGAAVDAVRPAAAAKGVRISTAIDPDAGAVNGDATRLGQVCAQLLDNALRFTPPGGAVDVRLVRVEDGIVLTVSDTGRSISPELLPRLFDRVPGDAPARGQTGLGLGLALVRELVALHGGTVRAESGAEDRGATFVVELPRLAAAPAAEAPGPDVGAMRLDGLRVLVVDDETATRESLQFLLEDRGADVTAVGSVGEARAALRSWTPDVLVGDIRLPDEDGYTLVRELRALSHLRHLPAVAMSAYDTDIAQRAVAAGYQAHLVKPFEPDRLVAAIVSLARMPEAASGS